MLARLLRLELIELSLLPFNLGLLRRQLLLNCLVLSLTRLHLITDQRSTDKPHGSADTRTGSGIASCAPNNRA